MFRVFETKSSAEKIFAIHSWKTIENIEEEKYLLPLVDIPKHVYGNHGVIVANFYTLKQYNGNLNKYYWDVFF